MVFEPYQSGTVLQNVWQTWNVLAGNWYGTRTSVIVGGSTVSNPCTQAAPCTTAQILTAYPNLGLRNAPNNALLFKAGGPWAPGFDGNVDALRLQVNGARVVYDFEPPSDVGTFQFSQANYTVNESQATATITVTRTGMTAGSATIHYAASDGTATEGSDYAATSGDLFFASGETSKTFTVGIINDGTTEPDETVTLTLSNPSFGAMLGTPNPATLTIVDNDGPASTNIIVVTPTNLQGWAAFNENTASAMFENGPAMPPYGTGSYEMSTGSGTGAGAGGKSYFKTNNYNGTRLDAISSMSYSTWVDVSTPGANIAPVIEMMVDTDGNGTRNTTLVFEPVYSPEQGAIVKGVWQFWNARTGKWRSTATVGPIVPNTYFTLDTFIAAFPNATIVEWFPRADGYGLGTSVGQASGGTWADFVGNVDGFEIGTNNASTINDFELALPTISINDVTQAEGNTGTTDFTFTVSLSGRSSVPVMVDYATMDGTATVADGDYQAAADTITFAPNQTTQQITVLVNGDTVVEPDETFTVQLDNPTNATIGDGDGTGTIVNDDTDVTLAVSPLSVTENGGTDLVYTFTRTGVTSGSLTVNFTVGGTADPNTDYTQSGATSFTPPTGSVTFAAGDATATVTIDPTPDTTVESDETVILTVAAGTGYNVASPTSATGTIVNDDTAVSVTVAPSSVQEDGGTNLVYTFTRNPETSGAITVNFSVGGAAGFGTDYTQTGAASFTTTTGSVTIPSGQTTATVTIDPTLDNAEEADETVVLTVTSGTGYNVGSPDSATGTIVNDDASITVAVSPLAADEDGTPNLVYTFTRSPLFSGPLTVAFSVGGTAVFGTDYTQTGADSFNGSNGTVTFADGSNTATVTIDPNTDVAYELDETVILTVGSGSGYSAGSPGAATGTITNDEAAPTLTIGDRIANEGDTGGTTNFVFTVTKSGSTEVPVTVNFATADGTTNPGTGGGACGPGVDYVSQTGMLTFPVTGPGSSSQTITILVCRDTDVEANETFFVQLSGQTDATLADGEGRGTIQNDDSPGTALVVNTTDDHAVGPCEALPGGDCTLREAITVANGSPGAALIAINFEYPRQ